MPVFDIFKRLVGTNATGERRGDDRVRATLGARVLVVDDSATIRAVLGKMLVQDGYDVVKAADGESAVEMAQSQFPDLIFLDIVLPGMSGFAVLRALRRDSRTRTTPIIMMSGNQQATEQFYVQRFGADGFIKKPFGRAEVFHSIRSLVQGGRMAARAETPARGSIPEGMTPEEWDAIPDVALPDDAHVAAGAGQAAGTQAPALEPAAAPVAAEPEAPTGNGESAAAPSPGAGGAETPPDPGTPPQTPMPPESTAAEAAAPGEDAPVDAEAVTGSGTSDPAPEASGWVNLASAPPSARANTTAGATGSWSVPARSMAMHPSVTMRAPAQRGSQMPLILHVNPLRGAGVTSAAAPSKPDADAEGEASRSREGKTG